MMVSAALRIISLTLMLKLQTSGHMRTLLYVKKIWLFWNILNFAQNQQKKYLKQNSKKIASRFVYEDNEESTITLVKTGLVSKKALRELLEKAKEKNMTILQSYILQQLNTDGISKRDFHI